MLRIFFQEAFVECFRNIDSFRFESTFGAWLKKILVNKCINHLKKKKIDLTLCETLPGDQFMKKKMKISYDTGKIFKGIEMLPDGYRVILTLYLLEGYDHSEIAQILEITESTSKSQYSRAKEKLREYTFNKLKIWTSLKNISGRTGRTWTGTVLHQVSGKR